MEPRYDHSNVSANTRRCMFDQTISRNPRFSRHEILIRGNAARGEKNSKKICLSEIIFLVALSRSGWNFNNHFVDFPGEPLERAAFAKKKGRRRKKKNKKRGNRSLSLISRFALRRTSILISAPEKLRMNIPPLFASVLYATDVFILITLHTVHLNVPFFYFFFFQDTLANCLAASVIYSPNEASCSLKNNTEDQSL